MKWYIQFLIIFLIALTITYFWSIRSYLGENFYINILISFAFSVAFYLILNGSREKRKMAEDKERDIIDNKYGIDYDKFKK